jgi:hypothetical protein
MKLLFSVTCSVLIREREKRVNDKRVESMTTEWFDNVGTDEGHE